MYSQSPEEIVEGKKWSPIPLSTPLSVEEFDKGMGTMEWELSRLRRSVLPRDFPDESDRPVVTQSNKRRWPDLGTGWRKSDFTSGGRFLSSSYFRAKISKVLRI